jgi:hypothetical protein
VRANKKSGRHHLSEKGQKKHESSLKTMEAGIEVGVLK